MLASGKLKRSVGSWQLQSNTDCYGNELETELAELLETETEIIAATKKLEIDFVGDGVYGEEPGETGSGAIADIVDFNKVVCFGYSSDGAPFCFDFRAPQLKPSVIWWDDINWRRVAPDFEQFIMLLGTDS